MTWHLTRYNPFGDREDYPTGMRLLQDTMSRLLSEPSARPWTPSVDVLETENEILLKADLPGVEMKDIDIRMEGGTLTLKGERRFEEEEQGKGYHRIERGYGNFVRCFSLPESVDAEKVNADYKDGVLTISLPKKEIAKPRSVKVQVRS